MRTTIQIALAACIVASVGVIGCGKDHATPKAQAFCHDLIQEGCVRAFDCVHEPATQVGGGLKRSWPSQSAAPHVVPSAIGEHVPCLPATAHELQLLHAATPQQ